MFGRTGIVIPTRGSGHRPVQNKWCQLIIGATGSYILAGLEDEASWETAKEALLSRLGLGSMKDEAWAALKNYKRGPKDIVEIKNSPKGYTLMMGKPLNGRQWTRSWIC